MNVTTFLVLDDASSFYFRFSRWLPMVYCLSTASFRCTLHRPQLKEPIIKNFKFIRSISVASVIALLFLWSKSDRSMSSSTHT